MKKIIVLAIAFIFAVIGTAHADGPSLGGPDGVAERLEKDEKPDASLDRVPALQPYFDWKAKLKEDYGLSFGLSGIFLYQYADETLPGTDDTALGGVFRFSGSWVLLGRDTGHPGRIEWRVENRQNLGGKIAPSTLGGNVGAAALNSGFGYSEKFDTDIAVLNWTQAFNDKTAGVAVGRLAFDVYLDPYAFQTFSRAFINRAFILNPTIGTTGIGALGGVAKGFVSENIWIGGQIYDGNAASGDFDLDTVKEDEFLYAAEIGWAPSIDRFKTDKVQLTYWYKDSREKAGVPQGDGLALTASFKAGDLLPFLRWGHSDGGAGVAAENAVSVGFEFAVRDDQAWALAFGWAEPSGPGLRDEYVIETSYRVQVSPSISLTPDLQLLIDPAKNPAADTVLVAGLRCIVNL